MFAQQLSNGAGGTLSRPFVLCVILILLFLSLQTDISSSTPSLKRSELRGGLQTASLKDGVKEQILMQLSISQEKLEVRTTHFGGGEFIDCLCLHVHGHAHAIKYTHMMYNHHPLYIHSWKIND